MTCRHTIGGIGFTDAQRDVLLLLVDGGSDKQIAKHLGLSPHTINAHLRDIFQKVDVHSRVRLAVWAVRNGL